MAGISQRMLAHYETKVRNPTPPTVVHLAKALGISIDELMAYKPVTVKEELDRRVVRKARVLTSLSKRDQKTIMNMIDAMDAKRTLRLTRRAAK